MQKRPHTFFNRQQTVSCTFCLPRPDIDPEFCVEGCISGRVMFVMRLLHPFCYRFNLSEHFWINRILQLGEGWRG